MYRAVFQLVGVSDLMFGRHVAEGKLDNETDAQREERLWQKKIWTTPEGQCFISAFAVTNGLVSAGKWLKRKIKGEGQSTYTARFRQGTAPGDNLLLTRKGGKLTVDDVEPVQLFVPVDGQHGGKKRVPRIFPTLHEWTASGSVLVFDGKITEAVFRDHLEACGRFIGFGSMRVENGGINGRFLINTLDFEEID